jgi:N-glycosylase/DNA lyase
MVTNLTTELGDPFGDGRYTFPFPERIASTTEAVLRKRCKTGYRAPYLLELAGRVASGQLDLEVFRATSSPTSELFQQLRQIKGIGPYAAGNILKLLGRYDYLGLDSWVRAQYAELYHNGREVKDTTIERAYASYGQWRGLFFWLDMTHHWHHEKFSR